MRLFQTTGREDLSWSQASGTSQKVDWTATVDRVVSGTPAWVLVVTAGAVLLALLGVAFIVSRGLWHASERNRKQRRNEQEAARAEGRESVLGLGSLGRQAYVALGGMVVSVYGMWGFALQTAQLPEPIAVGFIAMFDVMELVLFSQLYQRANPRVGWTPQLRLIHNTAWALVTVSATAQWIHAPSPVAAPFMAAMPIGAAWVIELEFRARMRGGATEDGSKAGPVRLIALLWTKGWTAAFSGLGLDPNSTSGQVARATLAKKAGRRLFRLRTLLKRHGQLLAGQAADRKARRRELSRAVEELEKARKSATRAMGRSDFAVDSGQALAVLRELGGWTQVDDIAMVDFSDPLKVTELMERVAIMPAAERIEAAERAAELKAEAKRAEDARQEADDARQRAEDEKRAALAEKERAETARKDAEEALAAAREQAEEAEREMKRAEDARQEAEDARQRAESQMSEEARNASQLADKAAKEQKKLSDASRELDRVRELITEETGRRDSARQEVSAVRSQLEQLQEERDKAATVAKESAEQAREAAGKLRSLQEALTNAQAAVEEHTKAVTRAAEQRRTAEEAQKEAARQAARTRAEAAEAAALLESLRSQLAERLGGAGETAALAEAGAFRSPEKQAGWEDYLAASLAGRDLPTAKELHEKYGVNEGNARNWLVDFREKRAAMIANGGARQSGGETARAEVSRALSSGARQEPRGHRADGHERAEDAARPMPINGQRQPV